MVYATLAQLAAFLEVDEADLPAGASRLLTRASELMDDKVVVPFLDSDGNFVDADPTTGQSDYQDSLRDAVCAQVEFWVEVGEEHDISGQRGQISVQGLHISQLPGTVADRAKRALARYGLLNRAIGSGSNGRYGFFGDPN